MPETTVRDDAVVDAGIDRQDLARRIAAGVNRARFALFWEDFWPRAIWPVGIVLTFVAVSWLGLWTVLPDIARVVALVGFGVIFLASLWTLRGLHSPTREEALARIERISGYRHRPLHTLEDSLPDGTDEVTRALWAAHRVRLRAAIHGLRAGLPAPGVARADRYALRVVLALLLFVGFFAAGDGRFERIRSAFRPFTGTSRLEARLDAWITPPDYTGKPAILLTAEAGPPLETDGTIRVPQNSVLVVRASGLTGKGDETIVNLADQASRQPKPLVAKSPDVGDENSASTTAPNKSQQTAEFEAKLATSSDIDVTRGGTQVAHWRFAVVPDKAPTIKLISAEPQASGTLKLTYEVADDYGVVSAEAHFEPSPDSFPVRSNAATIRPLVMPPDFALSLPAGRAKSGQATSFRDLTANPWSGGKVRVTLIAHNEGGQEGRSETREITLPAKSFTKPLARALVEQRRVLALDANRQPQVDDAFDALLIAPEHFYESSAVFLGVSKIYRDLLAAKTDDQLRDIIAFIWDVATGIEDGNLSQAEKAVRNAEDALQKALDRGATDQEIAKLTQDLRDALDKYMRELAEAARKNPLRSPQANQKVLRQQDLNRMLDRIENLAKTGSRDAARQMLSELQRMMENLQQGDTGEQADQQQSEQNEMLDKLGEMIQRQQQLMDKTHKLDRDSDQFRQNDGQQDKPMTPEEREQALKQLEKDQADLRNALKELRDKMAQQGLGQKDGQQKSGQKKPGQNGQQQPGQDGTQQGEGADGPFGKAGEAMGDAKDALGDGDTGDAVDAQGRAIDSLRDGAKKLLDQMAQQQQGRRRPGVGQSDGQPGDDPLGRPRRNDGPQDSNSVKVPDEIDTQRARQVLEAIRRRLSEPMRPRLELDYLERLLQGQQ